MTATHKIRKMPQAISVGDQLNLFSIDRIEWHCDYIGTVDIGEYHYNVVEQMALY